MVRNWFFGKRRLSPRKQTVRDLVEAVNRQDYSDLDRFLTDDFVFADFMDGQIEGIADFVENDRRFREGAGNPQLIIRSMNTAGNQIYVHGHLEGGSREINAPTIWQLLFRGDRICNATVIREGNQRTLPSFARRVAELSPRRH